MARFTDLTRALARSFVPAGFAALCLAQAAASAAPKYAADTPLQTAPDWKAEVLLEHPQIHHPSVVTCAPTAASL